MASAVTWEYKEVIKELTQGMEQAKQLRFHLSLTSPSEASDLLLKRILSSYEKSLLILRWNGTVGEAELAAGAPESSVTIDGSSDTPKKRKLQPMWTEQVRVNHQNRLEGPKEDGYNWRKYGQKDILGAKYPRSYYRCTYRLVQNCMATKQVQRSHNDPTIFEITFKGTHTCNLSKNATSPRKQEPKHNNSHNHHQQQKQQNPTLLNLKANLRVDTENLDKNEIPAHFSFPSTFECNDRENYYFPIPGLFDENQLETFSSFLYSPDISESNYLSGQMNNGDFFNLQHSETDIAEIISTHASTTNSPMGSIEFSIDTAELDPNFPFNNHGFFIESNFDFQ